MLGQRLANGGLARRLGRRLLRFGVAGGFGFGRRKTDFGVVDPKFELADLGVEFFRRTAVLAAAQLGQHRIEMINFDAASGQLRIAPGELDLS